jgi:hypothetical protein
MLLIISVKDLTSINGDPETFASGKWHPQKRRRAMETVEPGSLNVISAEFEVSSYGYYDESGIVLSEETGFKLENQVLMCTVGFLFVTVLSLYLGSIRPTM